MNNKLQTICRGYLGWRVDSLFSDLLIVSGIVHMPLMYLDGISGKLDSRHLQLAIDAILSFPLVRKVWVSIDRTTTLGNLFNECMRIVEG